MRFQLAALAALAAYVSAGPVPLTERSIFDKTSVIKSTKHIDAPVDTVIAALQNFRQMILLNPFVTNTTQNPSNPNEFTITDSIPLILGLSFPTTYHSVFTALPNGMEANNSAAAGVNLHNEWIAAANATGGSDVTLTDTLTANVLLSAFVIDELTTSHDQLLDTLASQLDANSTTS
ncbi:hypothetical protein HMN09_00941200 [Mycena chlorophos]|uniref:DUF7053 domain-containing protein n=1 Tax=Mycena chlorophos TaxID=658473 RepID=A0A8H6SKA7_MYCCL|nr:hypothetical protein HMN09_00941200 [Mycena chlorophos]